MGLPDIVSPEEWVAARKALLAREKDLTRQRDALERRPAPAADGEGRQGLRLRGPDGQASLLDLFEGRRQLIVGHFMFDPSWDDGCPSCTAGADEIVDGLLDHLHTRDTTFAYVSRAPLAKIEDVQGAQGLDVPVVLVVRQRLQLRLPRHARRVGRSDRVQLPHPAEYEQVGPAGSLESEQPFERPGRSHFLRDGDTVFHTYSVYARGLETIGGSYYLLDETALGRQEEWEEPKGRATEATWRDPRPVGLGGCDAANRDEGLQPQREPSVGGHRRDPLRCLYAAGARAVAPAAARGCPEGCTTTSTPTTRLHRRGAPRAARSARRRLRNPRRAATPRGRRVGRTAAAAPGARRRHRRAGRPPMTSARPQHPTSTARPNRPGRARDGSPPSRARDPAGRRSRSRTGPPRTRRPARRGVRRP